MSEQRFVRFRYEVLLDFALGPVGDDPDHTGKIGPHVEELLKIAAGGRPYSINNSKVVIERDPSTRSGD